MATFTTLTKTQIQNFLKNYPKLVDLDFCFKGLQAGTVNTLYQLQFSNKHVFYLKLDEVGKIYRLKKEFQILNFLKHHQKDLDFHFPEVLKQKNRKTYSLHKTKPLYLLKEVPGKIIPSAKFTKNHLQNLGIVLKKLHNLTPPKTLKKHTWHLNNLNFLFNSYSKKLYKKDSTLHQNIEKTLKDLRQDSRMQKASQKFIHSDLFDDNLHWHQTQIVGVLDFEYAGYGDPYYDLAMCIHAHCWQKISFQSHKIKALFKGYFGNKRFNSKQIQRLDFNLKHAALTIVLTRLKTFEFGKMPTKGPHYRSYQDFLNRYDWVQNHHFIKDNKL